MRHVHTPPLETRAALSLIFCGQTQIASGLAPILNATTPLFTLVAAHSCGGREDRSCQGHSPLAGFAGVALLIGPEPLSRPRFQDDEKIARSRPPPDRDCKYAC